MPRQDEPGLTYHVIARGIERGSLFMDNRDRDRFLNKLGEVVQDTGSTVFAFALVMNHFHLLIRRGATPLSTIMRRLLTAHAVYFNKRHGRSGHLFQNRYKAIVCGDEAYLVELIRYINLNPLKTGECRPEDFDTYRFASHSYILGKKSSPWYDGTVVLALLNGSRKSALQRYMALVAGGDHERGECEGLGRHLVCGCEYHSAGKSRNQDVSLIANDTATAHFVTRMDAKDPQVTDLIIKVCSRFALSDNELLGSSRAKEIAFARAYLAQRMSRDLGFSPSDIARRLGVGPSAVAKMLARAKRVQDEDNQDKNVPEA